MHHLIVTIASSSPYCQTTEGLNACHQLATTGQDMTPVLIAAVAAVVAIGAGLAVRFAPRPRRRRNY